MTATVSLHRLAGLESWNLFSDPSQTSNSYAQIKNRHYAIDTQCAMTDL